MVTRRSRTGEYVVVGCLLAPGALLLGAALLLPGDPHHGNALLVVLGLLALCAGAGLLLVQLVLPKPPEPPASPPNSTRAPED